MSPVEITAREVYDSVQQLTVRVVALSERLDRLRSRGTSRSQWLAVTAAWAAVILVFVKDFL